MQLMRIWVGVAAVLMIGSATARANVIVNGGFEDPANAPPGGYVPYLGGQSIPGWLVGGDSIDVHETGHTTALAGLQSLDVTGQAPGSITQTVPTTPGGNYQLTFGYAAHSFHPYSGDAMAEVRWGGSLIAVVSHPASPNSVDINWTTASYSLTASSPTTDLAFVSLSPNGGIILDEVSLVEVPEPASWLLLGIGLGAIAGRNRRR